MKNILQLTSFLIISSLYLPFPSVAQLQNLHLEGDAFFDSNFGQLKYGLPSGNGWGFSTLGTGARLTLRSYTNTIAETGATNRFSFTNAGRFGIDNIDPDEELVVGSNLSSGWDLPAITVGNATGGAVEVGNTGNNSLSFSSSSTFNRGRIISTDANGFGQGLIEMRTRQLNIGTSPGVSTTRTYSLRIQQNDSNSGGEYGLMLFNKTNTDENWELYVGTTIANNGNLVLYHNNANRGSFNATSGSYSATSDARLKTNISALSAMLPLVKQLSPKKYNYKTDLEKSYMGLLAQDLQQVFPELVTEVGGKNGEDSTLVVDYSQLTVIALTALQEQQEILENLIKRVEDLEKEKK